MIEVLVGVIVVAVQVKFVGKVKLGCGGFCTQIVCSKNTVGQPVEPVDSSLTLCKPLVVKIYVNISDLLKLAALIWPSTNHLNFASSGKHAALVFVGF